MKENPNITISRERYQELISKEILMDSYKNTIRELTEEVRVLREINSIDAKKKYYKCNYTLDIEDYKAAMRSGMSSKEYAELHNISARFLHARIKEETVKHPPLTKEIYLTLRKEGALNKDIAKVYNITVRTLYSVLNELGVTEEERKIGG